MSAFDHLGQVIDDPRKDDLKADSDLWLALLERAAIQDEAMYSILYYFRGHGTVLLPDARWGYRLQPVIGKSKYTSWRNLSEYEAERGALKNYTPWLIKTLKDLRPVFG